MTKTQVPNELTFSKTALNAAIAARADEKGVTLRDTHTRGLTLRKQSKGWHFAIVRKINGKVWRVSLGEYTATSDIAQIRNEAARVMLEIRSGEYKPARAKAEVAQIATDARTMGLGDALGLHLRVNPQLRHATKREYARAVLWLTNTAAERDATGKADVMGTAARVSKPIASLTADDVRAAYDRLTDSGKLAAGASMLRGLRAIWNTWASETEHDGRNPVVKVTSKRGRVKRVEPRTEAIAPAEQARWFAAMEHEAATGAHYSGARAAQVLFLTGLRLNEALGLRWTDIDLDTLTLTVTSDRMKAGTELVRPITRELQRVLTEQRKMNSGQPWVFPARRGLGHVADIRGALAKAPTVVRAHDLRRGFIVAGMLANVPEVAVKMLVGHSVADITQTYGRAIASELPVLAQRIEDQLLSDASTGLRVVA